MLIKIFSNCTQRSTLEATNRYRPLMLLSMGFNGLACLAFALLTICSAAQNIEVIYSFTNSGFSSLRNPSSNLTLGKDGNFYGTTQYGGSGGFGTVFKISNDGVLTVIGNLDAS